MKYLIIIIAIVLASCSKPKQDYSTRTNIYATAQVINQRYWAITLSAGASITSTGSADIEWDVYNGSGSFLYHRSATIAYTFDNSQSSNTVETPVQGSTTMISRNNHIVSINGTGGYNFSY